MLLYFTIFLIRQFQCRMVYFLLQNLSQKLKVYNNKTRKKKINNLVKVKERMHQNEFNCSACSSLKNAKSYPYIEFGEYFS